MLHHFRDNLQTNKCTVDLRKARENHHLEDMQGFDSLRRQTRCFAARVALQYSRSKLGNLCWIWTIVVLSKLISHIE